MVKQTVDLKEFVEEIQEMVNKAVEALRNHPDKISKVPEIMTAVNYAESSGALNKDLAEKLKAEVAEAQVEQQTETNETQRLKKKFSQEELKQLKIILESIEEIVKLLDERFSQAKKKRIIELFNTINESYKLIQLRVRNFRIKVSKLESASDNEHYKQLIKEEKKFENVFMTKLIQPAFKLIDPEHPKNIIPKDNITQAKGALHYAHELVAHLKKEF